MRQLETRKLLYDGMEGPQLYAESHCIYGNCFEIDVICRHQFAALEAQIGSQKFSKIISDSGFQSAAQHIGPFLKENEENANTRYCSQNGLPLYYAIKSNWLYVFSFGEVQPARYQLYCEGVWELYVIIAQTLFRDNKGEKLEGDDLKELLNHWDFNPVVFNAVMAVLTPDFRTQFYDFQNSEQAAQYRKWRNQNLPMFDLHRLPNVLTADMMEKIEELEKHPPLHYLFIDLLTHDQKTQLAQHHWAKFEAQKAAAEALKSQEQKQREKEWWANYRANPTHEFFGNMGEPETVEEYISRFGVDPRTGKKPEPETAEIAKPEIPAIGNAVDKNDFESAKPNVKSVGTLAENRTQRLKSLGFFIAFCFVGAILLQLFLHVKYNLFAFGFVFFCVLFAYAYFKKEQN